MKLRGKRALITGGSRRIGAAIARGLAAEGCHLVIHCRDFLREAKDLAAELTGLGVEVELVRAHLENPQQVLAMTKKVLKKGGVDILINNASVYYPTPWQKLNAKLWDEILSVNLKAPYLLARQLGEAMRKRGGRIINIADCAGEKPYKNYLPYCVSKGGLLTLTRALALELAPTVQVNSISPGPIVAPPWESKKVKERIRKRTPLQRWGGEAEIVKAVLYFCHSDFTTGANLVVDGGRQLV